MRYLTLPPCDACGEVLCVNVMMVYRVELFCANEACSAFCQSFMVEKADLR